MPEISRLDDWDRDQTQKDLLNIDPLE